MELAQHPLEHQQPGPLWRHVRDLLRLAVPIIIARVGWMTMQLVDTAMVGRYDTAELAFQSMAGTVVGLLFVPAMGMMLGTLIVAANAVGEKNLEQAGAAWRRALPYSFALGCLLLVLCYFGEALLLAVNIDPMIAEGAGAVTRIYGYGMPMGIVYIASMYFLEGVKRPLPGVALMVVANLINIVLNWVLIYGNLGFPALGAEGSAWATTTVRIVLTIAIVIYILTMRGHRTFGVRKRPGGGWGAWVEQRRLGYAAALSFGIEHGAFSALFIMTGWMGELAVASMNVVFAVFGFFFMAAAGIAGAAGVQVGDAFGRRSPRDMTLAGWTGLGLCVVILAPAALVLITLPAQIAGVFSDDPVLIAAAVPLYVLGGFALILDGAQTVLANALRGRHDKWYPTGSHFLSYVALMVPLGWYLGFPLGHGTAGLMESFIVSSVVSVGLLVARFAWLAGRDRRAPRTPSGLQPPEPRT